MRDVVSAGSVVFRPGRQVLLVHRRRYDDWSFPKGKLDAGEHRTVAAVREVREETGLHVRLGPVLTDQRYETGKGMKTVHYWVGRAVGDDDVSRYVPNDEITAVEWVDLAEARERLTYDYDRGTLAEALPLRRPSTPLVVLRHTKAFPRKQWTKDDRDRPLSDAGRAHAARIAPALTSYDVRHVVTSSSARCRDTVAPYAHLADPRIGYTDRLSEEDASPRRVRLVLERLQRRLAEHGAGGLVCTHRPVLPLVFDALGVPDPGLELGEMLVVHWRDGAALATERHLVP